MIDTYAVDRSNVDVWRSKLYPLREKCRVAKENHQKFKTANEKFVRDSAVKETLGKYMKVLKDDFEIVDTEYRDFKTGRLKYIESSINKKLDDIFPHDNYEVSLDVENIRKEKVIFQLKDREGVNRSTRVSAGGLMKSVLAYSSSVDLSEMLGSNKAWMDEAFAASSPESLTQIADVTEYFLERGFQIFMVEHKAEGYKNLPRREFNLIKDLDTGDVLGIEYTDY